MTKFLFPKTVHETLVPLLKNNAQAGASRRNPNVQHKGERPLSAEHRPRQNHGIGDSKTTSNEKYQWHRSYLLYKGIRNTSRKKKNKKNGY